ncbi:MAG: cell division protein FtsQ/DivIB [Alphaproteobacteria bacterium]|nr:cell division protein FtsQ/DivIB [Alphaproteobacteria bacterium]
MAAMKARRSVGAGRGGASSQARQKPLPRLAVLQMKTAELAESMKAPRERSGAGLIASGVLIAGALIAGATFAGGSLVDARDRVAEIADHAAAGAGFKVTKIHVDGVDGARRAEVEAAVLAGGQASLFSASPQDVKARVEKLDWVQRASVARYWPGSVRVQVERRRAVALWDDGRKLATVDDHGAAIAPIKPGAGLPRIVGAGAGPAVSVVLAQLENRPALRARLDALVRVNDRRWDLRLKDGAVIALPASDLAGAFARFDRADTAWRLLERPIARIDLRDPRRIIVLPGDVLAGGPGLPDARPVSAARGADV